MARQISVLMVDDSFQLRQSVKAMLQFENDFSVVGEAEDGEQALAQALALRPDLILMDVNMPGMDGIEATRRIMAQCPTTIVMISVQGDQGYLRRAMQAGARDYLIKPFSVDELVDALRRAHQTPLPSAPAADQPEQVHQGKVVTLWSLKGGVGKTTLAANLAAALGLRTRLKVAAVDLDLECGVLAAHLGVRPTAGILDLCRLDEEIGAEKVQQVLTATEVGGVKVLAAPPHPHQAGEVDGEGRQDKGRSYVAEVLDVLRETHDFVVIDTTAGFREANLLAFDRSDLLLCVTAPEMPTLLNTARGLEVLLSRLEYPADRLALVLNRAAAAGSISDDDISAGLDRSIDFRVPADDAVAQQASFLGQPFVWRRSRAPISEAVLSIGRRIATGGVALAEAAGAETGPRAKRRLFGLI